MDDDGELGTRNWGYYDAQPQQQQIKGNLGLQLMSPVTAASDNNRDTKPFLPTTTASFSSFLSRLQEPSPHPSMPFLRSVSTTDLWAQNQNQNQNHHSHVNRENTAGNKMLRSIPPPLANNHNHFHGHHSGHHMHNNNANFSLVTQNPLHMLPHQVPQSQAQAQAHSPHPLSASELAKIEQNAIMEPEPCPKIPPAPGKKRGQSQTGASKAPKPKKPKKTNESSAGGNSRGAKRDFGVVINGIDLDLSRIPTPICSCTGTPQQCYRWGIGGWQSACCTTSMSVYPLPMSTKRRGARIAGRKMSQGAFKKVLEKLAGEGYNLANPIDLRGFWAKHGTNKFVTIK